MKKTLYVLLIVSALTLAACGGQQAAAPQPSGGGAAAPTQPDSPPSPTQAPVAPTSVPEPEAGEAVALSDISQGLDALNSYRAEFIYSFEGTDNGAPVSQQFSFTTEFVRDPAAQRFTTSGVAGGDSFEIITTAGQNYMNIGGQCFSTPSEEDPTAQLGFQPGDFVGSINSSNFVGPENVNGVNTLHYRADVPNSPLLTGLSNSTTDFWVAPEGYLVKYVLRAEGTGQAVLGGSETAVGVLSMEYNVLDINQPLTITVPDDCAGAPEDVPVLPDTTDLSSFGDLITYTSATSLEDATEFYNTQMVANGWTAQPGGVDAPGFSQLTFTKDGRSASITISFDQSTNTSTFLIQLSGE